MARRGRRGYLPRVAPSISNQLVAIAREMQSTKDSTIMDAWQNGGVFEGKPATDEAVLAYWKKREAGLDPKDPKYEEIKDNILQLQYGIAQSKADLAHVQGKLSDGQYAKFFTDWAAKVPKNSEFWRSLQKDAAQLLESAKAKGRAAADKAKTDAFNAFVKSTTEGQIAIGNELTKAVSDLSQKTGLDIEGNGDKLLAMLTDDLKAHPDQYHALSDALAKGDPHFDGQITHAYFATHLQQANHGFDLIADRAADGGFATAYAGATKAQADMSQWGQSLAAWPVAQQYQTASNAFHKVWDSPYASTLDKQAAAQQFATSIGKMQKTPGLGADAKLMLDADAKRLLGNDAGDAPSFGAIVGHAGVDQKIAATTATYFEQTRQMAANPAGFAYAPLDENGAFDQTGKGAIGIIAAGLVPPGTQAVVIPSLGGQAQTVLMSPHAVYAVDPNDPNGTPKQVGFSLSYNIAGKTIDLYGYKDSKGENHWKQGSIFVDGASVEKDKHGDTYVTIKQPDVTSQIASIQGLTDEQRKTLAAGGKIETVTDTSAKGKAGAKTTTTVSIVDGHVSRTTKVDQIDNTGAMVSSSTTPDTLTPFNPTNVVAPSLLSAGNVPGVTFSSPLAGSVAASATTQSADQIAHLVNDPAFQQAFLSQTMQTLGTSNPLDPRIADAWKSVTTPRSNNPLAMMDPEERAIRDPRTRGDLAYPGQTAIEANKGQATINFGTAGTLKLPGLPNYLDGKQADLSALGGFAQAGIAGLNALLPGLGLGTPGQTPAGSGSAVTPTGPTPTVTPTTTITPTTSTVTAPTTIATPGTVSPTSGPKPLVKPGMGPVAS